MTPQEQKQIKKLLTLADAAAEFEFVDMNLVNHFHTMREELGLAKLLLLVQDYAYQQGRSDVEIPKTN